MATLKKNELLFDKEGLRNVTQETLGSSDSLDALEEAGFYTKNCSASEAPNGINGWFGFLVISAGYPVQLAFKINSNLVFMRHYDGNGWSSWTTLHS